MSSFGVHYRWGLQSRKNHNADCVFSWCCRIILVYNIYTYMNFCTHIYYTCIRWRMCFILNFIHITRFTLSYCSLYLPLLSFSLPPLSLSISIYIYIYIYVLSRVIRNFHSIKASYNYTFRTSDILNATGNYLIKDFLYRSFLFQ